MPVVDGGVAIYERKRARRDLLLHLIHIIGTYTNNMVIGTRAI